MSTVKSLIAEIEAFCKEADIAEATFGTRAAKDGKFVKRLRGGAGVTLLTVEKVQAYIAEQRKLMPRPKRTRPEAASRRAAA
jgi:hypothetical protein